MIEFVERLANWAIGEGWHTDAEVDRLDWQKIRADLDAMAERWEQK